MHHLPATHACARPTIQRRPDIYDLLNQMKADTPVKKKHANTGGHAEPPKTWTPYCRQRNSRAQRILQAHGLQRNNILVEANVSLLMYPPPPEIAPWNPATINWEPPTPGKDLTAAALTEQPAKRRPMVNELDQDDGVSLSGTTLVGSTVADSTPKVEKEPAQKGGKVTKARGKNVKAAPYSKSKPARKTKVAKDSTAIITTRTTTRKDAAHSLKESVPVKQARSRKTRSQRKNEVQTTARKGEARTGVTTDET